MLKNKKTPVNLADPKDFESLYHAYSRHMYRLCYYYTRDAEISKEMIQDIFKSVWERRNKLIIESDIESYLMRAAKLKVFQYTRDRVNHAKHLECVFEEAFEPINCTENQVFYNNLSECVNRLINKLPCRCKQVYELSREKGMTNKQIASALLISEKAVEKHLSKALKFLRHNLKEYQF
ncbi:MAG: sigma-70 family RNA polymerase sigma factor [Cytophagales bacterium]|nr:sigma-70 family RNA polymerase sigma factor [Cytophagales bacterium]